MPINKNILLGSIAGSQAFKAKWHDTVYQVVGISKGKFELMESPSCSFYPEIKNITLIARDTYDMTWDEKRQHEYYTEIVGATEYYSPESERYLLSIGVLTQDLADKLPCKVEWIIGKKER